MTDSLGAKQSAIVMVMLVACGGGSGGLDDGECRSTTDCDGELRCAGVDDGPICGIAPLEQCFDDNDCAGGTVCHATFDNCSADFLGSECDAPCVDDLECGSSFACDDGHCVAQSCDAGFQCEDREVCEPARITADTPVFDRHHGCFAVACASDEACGDRFCVNGTCQDAPGSCTEPILVP